MNHKRAHPRKRRPVYVFDRHRLGVTGRRSLPVENRVELLDDLPLLDPATAALLGLSMQSRVIC